MISVADAWQTILRHAAPLEPVDLPLASALGRTLRVAACADADSPPFDASAMDGYALRRAEAAGPLLVAGTSQAGAGFVGTVGPGECIRIFTGAPVPADTDVVVKQEDVERTGATVRIAGIRADITHIRRRGENRRAGETVVPAGTRLGPPELAALAAVGQSRPCVTRAPRCVHLATGDELVAPEHTPTGAQIRDSNSTLIAALLGRHGAELVGQARVPDELAAVQACVAAMPAHDVLLISGGASVGDHDLARPLLEALGYTPHFHGLNLRPGKPLLFAQRGRQLAFALPGNPVSHWVVFQLLLAPLLAFLETGVAVAPARLRGRLGPGGKLPPPDSRHTYWPGRWAIGDGVAEFTPLALASSGDGTGLVGANALLPLPAAPGPGLAPGAAVEFILCP